MKIAVVGTGYVGTVTGACLAWIGHDVICVDTDAPKVAMLERGEMPIYEPHLAELIAGARANARIAFSSDVEGSVRASDVIFIAVGTPPRPNGETNLSALEAAARSVGAGCDESRFRVVVNKSTVPVGCGNLVEALVRDGIRSAHPEGTSAGIRFGVGSNPEFLREGSAVSDSLYPDRIVLGAENECVMDILGSVYKPLIEQQFEAPHFVPRPARTGKVPLVMTTLTSAEMIKYASNAFLATKIGFANEIANLCERVGADVTEVTAGMGLDSRIGNAFLNAGIGWGGSCFGKDIRSLLHTSYEYGFQSRILEASLEVNSAQRHVAIQKLLDKLFILKGRTIALFGLAFKPNTDDLRDAPSLQIAEKLLHMGARVKAYDPVAMQACREQYPELRIQYADSPEDAAEQADAIVIATEWQEFLELDLAALARRMAHPVLIDGRNIYNPEIAVAAGFEYSGVGRPPKLARKAAVQNGTPR